MKIAIIILLCAAVPVAQASWPGYLNTTLSVTLSGSSPRQLAHKRALWGSPTYAGEAGLDIHATNYAVNPETLRAGVRVSRFLVAGSATS